LLVKPTTEWRRTPAIRDVSIAYDVSRAGKSADIDDAREFRAMTGADARKTPAGV